MCLAKYAVTSSIALILLWEEAVLRFILPHLECIARLALKTFILFYNGHKFGIILLSARKLDFISFVLPIARLFLPADCPSVALKLPLLSDIFLTASTLNSVL